jgi:hypothetical protein
MFETYEKRPSNVCNFAEFIAASDTGHGESTLNQPVRMSDSRGTALDGRRAA